MKKWNKMKYMTHISRIKKSIKVLKLYIRECYHHILFYFPKKISSSFIIWKRNFWGSISSKISLVGRLYVLVTMCRMRYFYRILIWCFCGALQFAAGTVSNNMRETQLSNRIPSKWNKCVQLRAVQASAHSTYMYQDSKLIASLV